jgi:uncharacterized protein (DUF2267 family)
MKNLRISTLDRSAQKLDKLLTDAEEKLGWEDRREQTYSLLRIVSHTLRDRLTDEELSDLSAQITTILRGVMFEDWKPQNTPKKLDKKEFLEEVESRFDFDTEHSTEYLVEVIFYKVLRDVSKGEVDDIKSDLPKKLSELITVK